MNISAYAGRFVVSAGFAGLIALSGLWKLSFWVGSQMAFFSATNCVAPLAGCFGGMAGGFLVFAIRTLMRVFWGSMTFASLFQGIPYLCASVYWATNSVVVRVGIPVVCMLLFWLHPVGFQAGIYAFYWLVPVFVALTACRSLFLHALASTFVAHAVGSVIWLYTVTMTPHVWIALVPVVAVERILFAAGMVVAHYAITAVVKRVSSLHLGVASFMNIKKSMPAR